MGLTRFGDDRGNRIREFAEISDDKKERLRKAAADRGMSLDAFLITPGSDDPFADAVAGVNAAASAKLTPAQRLQCKKMGVEPRHYLQAMGEQV